MTLASTISKDGERESAAPPIARIVVAVDATTASRAAIERAAALAGRFGARLYVLHAAPSFGAPGCRFADEAAIDELFGLAEKRLHDEARAKLRSSVAPVIECVRVGKPAVQVASFADEAHADLIVVGARARSSFDRILNGSVADEVLRATSRPVLVVREGLVARETGAPLCRRALAGVDYTESARDATTLAAGLALRDGGTVDAVHVIDASIAPSLAVRSALQSADLRQSLLSVASANVRRWLDGAITDPDLRARIQPLVRIGRPAQVLAELTASDYDLVACGSHGRGALARVLIGSTTDMLVGAAACPVLIAPARRET
jgi:nucleotide-binding universal stress UspA family protein